MMIIKRSYTVHLILLILFAALFGRFDRAVGETARPPGKTFKVDTTVDAVDVALGDGLCATVTGECSLRAAVQESNASAGDDTILVRAETYTFTRTGNDEDEAETGDLDIYDHVTLQGDGANITVIDAAGLDRIFHIIGPFNVILANITLENGMTGTGEDGGAIFNSSNANTRLSDAVVRNSTADQWGGGIANDDSAEMDIINVLVEGNAAGAVGGGIDNFDGIVTVKNSIIRGNTAGTSGGGIYNDGSLVVETSWIDGNTAALDGGGIFSFDSLGLERTTVSNNMATGDAGGLLNWGKADVENVTISGNTAGRDAGGIFNLDEMTAKHLTIYDNSATGVAGGVFHDGPLLDLYNSIIANNQANNGANCELFHTITSNGGNLDSGNSCALDHAADLTNTPLTLPALSNNGGIFPTHKPGSTSVTVDAAVLATCLQDDQREIVPRPQGNGCDIGAIEVAFDDIGVQLINDYPDPVLAAETYTYELLVSNVGDSNASDVTVTTQLPAGTAFVAADGTGWDCTHTSGAVTCNKSPIVIGANETISITATAPNDGGVIEASTSISSPNPDTIALNNNDTITTTVTAVADLTIIPQTNVASVEVGDVLAFSVDVVNNGVSTAEPIELVMTLPIEDLAFVSATGATCTTSSSAVTCQIPSLAAGATTTIAFNLTALRGDRTLSAPLFVSSETLEANNVDNSATALLGSTAVSRADLTVSVTESADPVPANSPLSYSHLVSNQGPNAADGITLTATLDPNVTYVSHSGMGWTCTEQGATVTCTQATLAANSSSTVTLNVTTPPNPSNISHSASVASTTADPNSGDNGDTINTVVGDVAELGVTMSSSVSAADVNDRIDYSVTVVNNGPSGAAVVVATMTLPSTLTYIDDVAAGWSCGFSNQVVTCNRLSLAAGESGEIVIQTQLSSGAVGQAVVVEAAVTSSTPDGVAGNDSATTTVQIGTALPTSTPPPTSATPTPTTPTSTWNGVIYLPILLVSP